MYICEYHHGCRVTITDWIGKDEDGKVPIHIEITSFFARIVGRTS